MTKLVGSELTACHETVWLLVPEFHTVEVDGEVTMIAVVTLLSARDATRALRLAEYIVKVCMGVMRYVWVYVCVCVC